MVKGSTQFGFQNLLLYEMHHIQDEMQSALIVLFNNVYIEIIFYSIPRDAKP